MKSIKVLTIIFGVILTCVAFLPAASANESNQQTKLTFSQPVEIPGHVLPAGTYWFVLADNEADRSTVQVFSEDWKTLYATLMTVSAERRDPPDGTLLKFAERESAGNPVLVDWFYPGNTIGHEFVYSKQEEKELAQDKQTSVVVPSHASGEVQMGN